MPPIPGITSSLADIGRPNALYQYRITASNNPTSFAAGGLPGWLTIDPQTGQISGTQPTNGTFLITLTAANAAGAGSAVLNLTIAGGSATPRLANAKRGSDGLFSFDVVSDAGVVIEVQASTNLAGWLPVAILTNTVGTTQFKDLTPMASKRFYRLKVTTAGAVIVPRLADGSRLPNGQFTFSVASAASSVLEVQTSTDLLNWTPAARLTNTTGAATYTDSVTGLSRRFYRARLAQ